MNLDQYRIAKDSQVRLAIGRPTFFMVTQADQAQFDPKRCFRLILGLCKRATVQGAGSDLELTFTGAPEPELLERKVAYLCSTSDSLGLAIERSRGKTCLVAMFVTFSAFEDARQACAEIEEVAEDEEAERPAYSTRDRDTGEEYLMFDPPGGTFRDLGDEYKKSEETGIQLRDRRDGLWANGKCLLMQPEGPARAVLLAATEQSHLLMLNVPRLDRTQVFPDGYEVIEEGSEDGWFVWQWCAENATGVWRWLNLATDGGPWLELKSMHDLAGLLDSFPALLDLNPALSALLDEEGEA